MMSTISILRMSDVIARTGLSRSSIYLRVAEGTFPKPAKLGERAVGWSSVAIDDWINQRFREAA